MIRSFFATARGLTLALCCASIAALLGACDRIELQPFPGDSIRSQIAKFTPTSFTLAPVQREFLTDVAQSSLFEIAASRVALARGGSALVRRYAESTLRDRVSIDTDLEQLAQSVGVVLPSRLSDDFQARLAVLEQLTGSDFDRAYARNVGVLAQEQALAAFERAADPDGARVQRFAADRIPTLRRHLQQGRLLATEVDRTNMA
jgi:putative membrane protein